jgi:hypothetical protein
MSISSIPSSPPTPVVQTPPQPQPAPTTDSSSNAESASQPVQAPLPPGQGTRVNQLV